MARNLSLIGDRKELAEAFCDQLRELFQVDTVTLLLLDLEEKTFVRSEDDSPTPITTEGRLAHWLVTNGRLLRVQGSRGPSRFLADEERDFLLEHGVHLCVPMISVRRLTGIVGLGWTERKVTLSRRNSKMLVLLAGRIAGAFQNLQLLDRERVRLRELYRAERLAAVGELAASVAHEVRNPLTAIRSTVQFLLRRGSGLGDEDRSMGQELLQEIDRIDDTLRKLLGLARPSAASLDRVDLEEVVEQSLRLVEIKARRQGVPVVRKLAGEPMPVEARPEELKQVFLNLFLNALEAEPPTSRLTVRTAIRRRSEPGSHSPRWAQVAVENADSYIPPEHLDQVFDPEFTTKEQGTGLGLSISQQIVRRYHGELELESSRQRGTVAYVRLPTSQKIRDEQGPEQAVRQLEEAPT